METIKKIKLEDLTDPLYEILPGALRSIDVSREENVSRAAVSITNITLDNIFVDFAKCVIEYEIDAAENTVTISNKEIEIDDVVDTESERIIPIALFAEVSHKIEESINADVEKVAEIYKNLLARD